LRAFSAFDNLRGEDAKPWLLAIVRNTYRSWMRRRLQGSSMVELEEQGAEQPREPSPDPEETLLIACDREQVRKALEQLPSDFREAVVLREIEGLSYKEIAAAIGAPLGTVMSRLSRGRDWLSHILSSPRPVTREEGAGLR
jgi:RNA polymerase sigma factor (sigma-70 family)